MQDIALGAITMVIALIISLVFYKKLEPPWFRIFPWFLFINLAIQLIAYWYWRITGKSNHFIYNIYILYEYGFYILICYLAARKAIFKRIIAIIAALFLLCYVIWIPRDFFHYNSSIRNLSVLLSFICCILFLIEVLASDEVINFFSLPMFWIATGIMIANLGTFLYFSFFNYILRNNLDPDGTVYIIMTNSLAEIEFGFFAIGFLCKKIWKKTR